MSLILPWALILISTCFVFTILKRYLKFSTHTSLIVGFSISPILIAQLLFLLYRYFPKYPYDFYLVLLILVVISPTLLLLKPEIELKWPTLPKLNLASYFYLISITAITILTFVRMIFWPLAWYDQTEYYAISHTYYSQRQALNEVANLLRATDGIVTGVRPGVPVITNYFALFSTNNVSVEKNLMLTIFYYFVLTLLIFYAVAKSARTSVNGRLLALFLMTTCFFFINFTIFGFKEIILVAFGLATLALFQEVQKNKNKKPLSVAITLGSILGSMSFIHFTGVILAALILVSFLLNIQMKIAMRAIFCVTAFIVMYFVSLGEVRFFIEWAALGLHAPALSQGSQVATNSPKQIAAGELKSFGFMTELDSLLKGKLQALSQVQSFGLVFWLSSLGVVASIKEIAKERYKRFIASFVLVFLVLTINPFSIFNHHASYVFLISPKYYLLLLPFFLLLIVDVYPRFSKALQKVSRKFVTTAIVLILTISLVFTFFQAKILTFASLAVTLQYNSKAYYAAKFKDFCLLYIAISILVLLITIKSKKYNRKITEILFFGYIFLVPFIFFFNNNYGISETLTKSFLARNEKIGIGNKAKTDLYDTFSILLENHTKGEMVLLLSQGNQAQFNYYLLTSHNEYFNNPKIANYVHTYTENALGTKYEWILREVGDEIPEQYYGKYDVYYENKGSQLLRII